MNNALNAILAIVGGAIGLAVVAVLVSPRAQTPQVFSSAGNSLATVIGAAVAPVTGQNIAGTGAASGGLSFGGLGSFLPGFSSLFGG